MLTFIHPSINHHTFSQHFQYTPIYPDESMHDIANRMYMYMDKKIIFGGRFVTCEGSLSEPTNLPYKLFARIWSSYTSHTSFHFSWICMPACGQDCDVSHALGRICFRVFTWRCCQYAAVSRATFCSREIFGDFVNAKLLCAKWWVKRTIRISWLIYFTV